MSFSRHLEIGEKGEVLTQAGEGGGDSGGGGFSGKFLVLVGNLLWGGVARLRREGSGGGKWKYWE